MFNRFLEAHLPRVSRFLGGAASKRTQSGTKAADAHGHPLQGNPLLDPLIGAHSHTQASATSRPQDVPGYFSAGASARDEVAGTATKAATPSHATASAPVEDPRFPAVTQLIHRIKTCGAQEAPALIADLRQALHLRQEPHRLGISAVRKILQSNDWIDSVIEGRLDLASLLPAIGQVTDLPERRALMGAIEAAVAVRQAADPDFAARMDDRLGVPDAAPRLLTDAVQAKVLELFGNPETRQHIDSIATMFGKLGTGTVPLQAVAVNLSTLLNRIGFLAEMSPDLKARLMPCLIENLLHRRDIDMGHARIARLAADRVRSYVKLLHRNPGTDPDATTLRPSWSCRLLWSCIDEQWLDRKLDTPDGYAEILPVNHRSGRLLRTTVLGSIGSDLRRTIDDMEAAGFLKASTLARLRACLPGMLEAIYQQNARIWHSAEENETDHLHKPAAVPVLTRAQLMQRLDNMSTAARAQLMHDLLTFFRTGTMEIEGYAFIWRHGNAMSVLLEDSELARAVLARLKQIERTGQAQAQVAQTTTGSGSSLMPNRS